MILDKTSVTYAHAKLKIDDYWNRGITGLGVKIGIVDDGMGTHEALPIFGGLACGKHTTYLQQNEHATHCAGIALGRNLINGEPTGIAPDAELYSIRMYYKTYADRVKSLIEAIDFAVLEGIDILSMSIHIAESSINYDENKGSTHGIPKHLRIPMKQAFLKAYRNNIIIVVASGNNNNGSGKDNIELEEFLPKMPNVVTVANLTLADTRRATSGVGQWVDIAGYGSSIKSTLPLNQYGYKTGTSMSTPQIAGVLALYKQILIDAEEIEQWYITPHQVVKSKLIPKATVIINTLLNNAIKLDDLTDEQQGKGVPQPPQELYDLDALIEAKSILRVRDLNIFKAVEGSYYRDEEVWKEMQPKIKEV